jgi:Spy/CpxP family protein refolding chaperone
MKVFFATLLLTLSSVAMAESRGSFWDDDTSPMDKHMEIMQERLDLSDEQRDKVEKVLTEHREVMQARQQKTRSAMEEILTPEQQDKMKTLRQERREKIREKFRDMRRD